MSGAMMAVMNNVKQGSTGPSPVTSGLILHYDPSILASYPGTGSVIYDLSPNAITGTVTGNPTVSNNSFVLNGTSQWFFTGDVSSAKGTAGAHTVEVWVKPLAMSSIWSDRSNNSISATGSPYRASGCEIYSVGPFNLINTMLWNGASINRTGGGTAAFNTWFQIVRTYNGSNVIAYINTVAAGATPITWSSPNPWYIGFGSSLDTNFFATGGAFRGNYGVARVYNRVLTSVEVTQNYNATKAKYGL